MSLTVDDQLNIMQLYGQGLMSKRTAIERLGIFKDVDEELDRIEEDAVERRRCCK